MNKSFQGIYSLIKKYRFNSIFFSHFRYTLVLMIVPFVIVTIFMTQNTYRNVYSEAEKKNIRAYENSRHLLNSTFESVDNIFNQLVSDSEITYLLSTDTSKESALNLRKFASKFHTYATNTIISNPMFDSIFLYSKKNNYVYATNGSNTIDNFFNLDWYNAYIEKGQTNTTCSSVIENEGIISIVINIYEDSPSAGVVVFNIKKSYLNSYIEDYNEADFNFCIFVRTDNESIYSFGDKTFEEAKKEATFSFTHEINGSPVVCHGFLVCNLTGIILQETLPIVLSYIILVVLSIVFVAFLSSLKFYKSIANIVTSFENATLGKEGEIESNNEIHYITNNIVNILLRNRDIENDLVKRFSELKKAQSIALQSQMNPHFLFNTLNLVNTIIIEDCGYDTEAVTVVKELAELLALSLDTKNYIVSVESELNYAKKYIDIELIRNDYNFTVDWNIDPELLHLNTLKMILQPILENAIFHGISTTPDNVSGKIIVSAYKDGTTLVITVADNGSGIDAERLAELEEKLNSEEIIESKHIGLANVNGRIKLIYGNEYGCSIQTSSDGTIITVTQPI